MDYTAIGKRICAKRKQKDLSQEEFARRHYRIIQTHGKRAIIELGTNK